MSREIKFRAWDILNKKMLNWRDIFDLPAWEIFPGTPEQRCYEVMQYTGLKDKNNIEVYEGDIVQNVNNNNIWKVVYNHSNACYELTRKKDGINSWEHGAIIGLPRSYKVIGNIYENKELLQ